MCDPNRAAEGVRQFARSGTFRNLLSLLGKYSAEASHSHCRHLGPTCLLLSNFQFPTFQPGAQVVHASPINVDDVTIIPHFSAGDFLACSVGL